MRRPGEEDSVDDDVGAGDGNPVPSKTTTFDIRARSSMMRDSGGGASTTSSVQSFSSARSALERRPSVMAVPTNADERLHVTAVHGHGSTRHKILSFLHSKYVEYTMLGLLLLDLVVLMLEMFIAAEFPDCNIVKRNAISCCPAEENGRRWRWLAGDGSHADEICPEPLIESPEYPAGCDDHKYSWLHPLHVACFAITISVLSLFFIELMLMVFCLGLVFFQHFFYVADLFIVTVSLVLEISFYVVHEDILATLTAFLVLMRVWRFVRIGHSVVEATVEMSAKRFDKVVELNEQLTQILLENDIDVPQEMKEEMHKLKSLDPWFVEEEEK